MKPALINQVSIQILDFTKILLLTIESHNNI